MLSHPKILFLIPLHFVPLLNSIPNFSYCLMFYHFINPPPLPLSCEISGALHLAQLGLTAGLLGG